MTDPVPEMVERATKAYVEKLFNCQWDREGPVFRRKHMEAMQAAIEAMREPTEAMLNFPMDLGGYGYGDECYQADPCEIWRSMIDIALHHGPV